MKLELVDSTSVTLLLIGFGINAIAGAWFLFAIYAVDRHLARWSQIFPMLSIRLALENPGTCLLPFILQHVGVLFFIPYLVHFVRVFNAMQAGAVPS